MISIMEPEVGGPELLFGRGAWERASPFLSEEFHFTDGFTDGCQGNNNHIQKTK